MPSTGMSSPWPGSRYPKPVARGAAQARRKAAKSQPGRRKQAAARRPPTIEQTMFFPRLRRQAKWVFLLLAFVFAGGFVFFGVGSGSTGLGDLLRGNFNIFGSNGTSTNSSAVKSALKKTQNHPKDPNAWNALATAYQTDGKTDDANKAYQHVLKLRPNDTTALQSVAAYYQNKAQIKYTEAQNLQAQAPLTFGNVIGVSSSSQIGQMLGNDPTAQQREPMARPTTRLPCKRMPRSTSDLRSCSRPTSTRSTTTPLSLMRPAIPLPQSRRTRR